MTFNKGPLSVGRLFQVSITFASPDMRQLNHPHGGALRPLLHVLHLSDASSFQIGVSRDLRTASSGMPRPTIAFGECQACQIITLRKLLYLY
jgi:hypothetical protein